RELLQLVLAGEPAVPEQKDRFLEGRVPRQIVDRDADVLEDPLLAVDERHPRFSGNDPFQTLGKGTHCGVLLRVEWPNPLQPEPAWFRGPREGGTIEVAPGGRNGQSSIPTVGCTRADPAGHRPRPLPPDRR